MDDSNRCDYDCCDEFAVQMKFPLIKKLCHINTCLNHITKLDLSSSDLCEVPEAMGNLTSIVKLDLSSNQLVTLPLTFNKFQHLTELVLSHNKFQRFPQCLIDSMCSISTLDLSHNQLLNMQIKPFCLQHLKTLNVSHNLTLKIFPRWLWSLECKLLESLNISFTNCLDNIEEDPYMNMYGISKCLKYLDISNTNSEIRKIDFIKHFKNLRTIVLDNKNTVTCKQRNYFDNVPLVFNYRFKCIVSLSMNNVNLSVIGKHVYFSLPNLRFLNLANNSIVLLPDSFSEIKNLEVCDFSNNQILSIPDCYKKLSNLKKLVLNNNWISVFPEILENLSKLEFLDLYANKLTICPSWSSNIKSIDLEQNYFSTENSINQTHKENYSELLVNLRSSINECRITGPLCTEEIYDSEFLNCTIYSSRSSLYSNIDNLNEYENEENQDDNFQPEEIWECNSYEQTTALFDPKKFESNLINDLLKLEKSLTLDEKPNNVNTFKNVVRFTNEHYFCPNDELPKTFITK